MNADWRFRRAGAAGGARAEAGVRMAHDRSRIILISSLFLKGENPFPVVPHADNDPALLHRFVVQANGQNIQMR